MYKNEKLFKVKPIIGLLFKDYSFCEEFFNTVNQLGIEIQLKSKIYDFNQTDYYENEMGINLKKMYISIKNIFSHHAILYLKIELIKLEKIFTKKKKRKINLDAGFLDLHKVVLLSKKNGPHKIFLNHGIWADLNLIRKNGVYANLPWTFPDLKNGQYDYFFEKTREKFKQDLKKLLIIYNE